MLVKIKRIDTTLPLPDYQTTGAVAFDLYSREEMTIEPNTLGFIPTNLIIEVPSGYMLALTPRSSTPKKKGLLSPHGIGIVDTDYNGEEDEIKLMVYNFTNEAAEIQRGERIGQASFIRVDKAEFEEVKSMNDDSRGGFGSTG